MSITARAFLKENAEEICRWKYENEYSIYNFPKWSIVEEQHWQIADAEIRKREFLSVYEGSEYIGFFRMHKEKEFCTINLGLKPSYCGKGYGDKLMSLIKNISQKRRINKLRVEVRCFNKRAVKCYEKSGFSILNKINKDTPIGNSDFYIMEYMK